MSSPTQVETSTPAHKRTILGVRQDRCPACGDAWGTLPFCEADGTVRAPFVLAERYEVQRLLGAGGMAFVFLARHLTLGKSIAIKILRPRSDGQEHTQRFLREARVASQLEHENVVGTLDFNHDERSGLHYFAMEYLRGRSLHETLLSDGALSLERALSVLVQLARALGAAHELGIVHRDLTPKNVVLTTSSGRRDFVKLCDFGVSRSLDADVRITATGQILGTPAYMAPEQVRGEEPTPACDIYAFGTIAFELLTGEWPIAGGSAVALIAQKLLAAEHRPSARTTRAIPAALDDLVERCLRLEPSERPTAQEAEAALTELLGVAPAAESVKLPTNLVGALVGNYRVEALVGSGGMGAVYRGEHQEIGTRVAIKVLHPEVAQDDDAVARFIREAKTSSAIGSPHLPRYFDFGRLADGRTYAVMDYVEGESLGDRLERVRTLPLADTRAILLQCATALQAAHSAGVVHRDIKPDNIMLTEGNAVRILDFGIAKVQGASADRTTTQVGSFLGTPVYCAPEQIFGGAPTPQTDLYALACTAYEMLTGTDAFEAESIEGLLKLKSSGDRSPVAQRVACLPDAVARTLTKALEFEPRDRHPSLAEFAKEVGQWGAPAMEAEQASGVIPSAEPPVRAGTELSDGSPVATWPAQPEVRPARSRAGQWTAPAVRAAAALAAAVLLLLPTTSEGPDLGFEGIGAPIPPILPEPVAVEPAAVAAPDTRALDARQPTEAQPGANDPSARAGVENASGEETAAASEADATAAQRSARSAEAEGPAVVDAPANGERAASPAASSRRARTPRRAARPQSAMATRPARPGSAMAARPARPRSAMASRPAPSSAPERRRSGLIIDPFADH
ncbi:MAG: protein kinase [Myxococcota bacterium]